MAARHFLNMTSKLFRAIKRCFGIEKRDNLLWHKDLQPHAYGNYSVAMVQANSLLEDQGQVFTSPCATYVGVYDGHGGPETSRFIKHHLFSFIQKYAAEHGGLSADVMKKAVDATEEEFLNLVKQSCLSQPQIASVGSCCLVGAISNGVLYVANVGDSRVVLGRRVDAGQGKSVVTAERLSTDHNVGVEEVRKEVESQHPDDSHIVMCSRGVWRIKGIIQISRAIGDVFLKKPEFNRHPYIMQHGLSLPFKSPLVTAEPSILTRKLELQDLFLIFASDGLWEQVSDEDAVEIVTKNPRKGIAKRLVQAAVEEAARKRRMRYDDIRKIKQGRRRYFHDDITVIVVYLDHSHHHLDVRLDDCLKLNFAGREGNQIVFEGTNCPVDIFSINAQQEAD